MPFERRFPLFYVMLLSYLEQLSRSSPDPEQKTTLTWPLKAVIIVNNIRSWNIELCPMPQTKGEVSRWIFVFDRLWNKTELNWCVEFCSSIVCEPCKTYD